MGQGKPSSQINVCTLNYSGIFLSPFEFYGMDNWRELEDIGKIFEDKLRDRYAEYKETMEYYKVDTKLWPRVYERKKFEWVLGKLDKKVHRRYTPLKVTKEEIKNHMFPGIDPVQQFRFETEDSFGKSWMKRLELIIDKVIEVPPEAEDEAFVSSDAQRYGCQLFDYLNFEAIVHYVYNQHKHELQETKKDEWEEVSEMPSERSGVSQRGQKRHSKNMARRMGGWTKAKGNILEFISRLSDHSQRKLTYEYKKFMEQMFEVIDLHAKRKLTVEHLFKMDIIFLQEATQPLKQILNQENITLSNSGKNPYQILLSHDSQSMVLMRGSLPFLKKQYYDGYDHAAQNDIKRELAEHLEKYVLPEFIEYWRANLEELQDKKKAVKQITAFLKNLQKDSMFWFTECVLAEYHQDGAHFVIGNFHLSSKAWNNAIEVQLLGAILYWIMKTRKDAKFIIAGDFNSYVAVDEKEDPHGLFTFVKKTKEIQTDDTRFRQWKKGVFIYPNHRKMNTTNKKRTILQPQANKINFLKTDCIDQIITNFPILYEESSVGEIKTISKPGHNAKSLIPYDHHPYDHFVVKATLNIPQVPVHQRPQRVDHYQEDEFR